MKRQIVIPAINLQDFISGSVEAKMEFVNKIGTAFSEYGFASVSNILVSQKDIEAYYDAIKLFFALPEEEKLKYEKKEWAGQRGYTSFGREHAKGSLAPDLKEFWQMGQTVVDGDHIKKEYIDNVLIDEYPEFNELGATLYKGFEDSGRILLRSIALYLELEEYFFDAPIRNGNSILRAIHYPPISSEPKSAIRAEAHEDINLITLLVGASAEGLQLLGKDGEWYEVIAPENSIVINVGDMLQRLTNNKLRSTTHRVVNPPKEKWHTPRYSIPFFLHPRSEMRLDCLPSCIDSNHPIQYEPIAAGDYLNERLREIGLLEHIK
jgi:isopenicillin N synthase-like dioxygenase